MKAEKRKAKAALNRTLIIGYRKEGKTLQAIANKLGVTRQRIEQIEYSLGLPKRGHKKAPRISVKCANPKCDRMMSFTINGAKKKYCTKKCRQSCKIHRTIAEKRAIWNKRTKDYYHNVLKKRPDFHEIVRRNNEKYYKKHNKK